MGLFNRESKTTQQLADEQGRSTGTGNAPARSVQLTKQFGPATPRADVEAKGGIDMTKRFDKAGVSLSKRGLDGIRAEAVMLLDHSGSMISDYENGTVQTLVERALGFALQIDTDGTIPVIRFDYGVHKAIDVNIGNYAAITQNQLYERDKMGSTNLTAALDELLTLAKKTTQPIFAIIVTDGQPNDTTTVTQRVRELAKYPVFLKFLAIQNVPYLQKLDDMDGRLIDNADAKFISDPAGISDLNFADAMTDEWATWIGAAQVAGILV